MEDQHNTPASTPPHPTLWLLHVIISLVRLSPPHLYYFSLQQILLFQPTTSRAPHSPRNRPPPWKPRSSVTGHRVAPSTSKRPPLGWPWPCAAHRLRGAAAGSSPRRGRSEPVSAVSAGAVWGVDTVGLWEAEFCQGWSVFEVVFGHPFVSELVGFGGGSEWMRGESSVEG